MASTLVRDYRSSNHRPDTPYASSELPTTPLVSRPPPSESLPGRPRIPSLSSSAGRPRGLSTVSSTSSVRRKPLPSTASPLATRYSSTVDRRESVRSTGTVTPYSIGSPVHLEHPLPSTYQVLEGQKSNADREQNKSNTSIEPIDLISSTSGPIIDQTGPTYSTIGPPPSAKTPSAIDTASPTTQSHHVRLVSDSVESTTSSSTDPGSDYSAPQAPKQAAVLSIFSSKPTPPHLTLSNNATLRSTSNETTPNTNKQLPKSPGALKLGNFFSWGGNTSPASSTTTFSDERGLSPSRSPASPQKTNRILSPGTQRPVPRGIDVPKANSKYESYFSDAYKDLPPITPATTVQVDEMEAELKTITAELATSIHREMELEDLVERLQSEATFTQGPGKRTSDYFSDSGTSSVKYGGEPDSRTDGLDRLHRKAEREKAQIKLELNQKVQEERYRRKGLEAQIRTLEQKASQIDLASMNSLNASGRLRELENTCEDLRRRLAEEKQVKDNFEDLLTALRSELQKSHNERDNLRDEVVPQLRARVEGLEAQAAEHEKLTYENTRMQQEMQALKDENNELNDARKAQVEMQQQMSRFKSIPEESSPRATAGLIRSNSVAHSSGYQRSAQPPPRPASRPTSLIRSSSVKIGESREVLAERLKDVELQRDALHSALKSLLERQEYQNRENQKRIRQLEMERDRATNSTPRRQGYNQDVTSLREEINTLRRRADEAIEQKWLCEKGLSGIKMDLDRAEQEIGSLRDLLNEHDILIPNGIRQINRERGRKGSATSDSLENAYRDLQRSYIESLQRIKQLEEAGSRDVETEEAVARLERSLSMAINERDFARQEADAYRQSAEALQAHDGEHIAAETALADELRASAKRVEELATQVRQQLAANAALRQRLADTIERGEKDQKSNASKIVHMQGKLRSLEDALMAAQQASEERIVRHESEIRELKENHNTQLLRVKDGLKSPRAFSPKTPLSPLFAGARSPRLERTTSGRGVSITEESKTEYLKHRVLELEKALEDADGEMQEVVGKMNIAQIEVMELQNEREEAVRQTRWLQAKIEEESLKSFRDRFATLSS